MPWDWPVEVNYLEAKAFCNWKSAQTGKRIRLPTEEEWYLLRDRAVDTDQPYWETAPGNINLEHYASSCPVTQFAFGDFYDVIGNVWQWTETPITGFEGFEVHPYYDDFSTPTFDGLHNLIKGGSWISTGNEATRDSRYAFRRHFFQHAGLRYVESDQPVSVRVDVYETDRLVAQYCESHYGEDYFGVANFPKTMSQLCLRLDARPPSRQGVGSRLRRGPSYFRVGTRVQRGHGARLFGTIHPHRRGTARRRATSGTPGWRRENWSPTTKSNCPIWASKERSSGSLSSRPTPAI